MFNNNNKRVVLCISIIKKSDFCIVKISILTCHNYHISIQNDFGHLTFKEFIPSQWTDYITPKDEFQSK
jgi:hypothetical protein